MCRRSVLCVVGFVAAMIAVPAAYGQGREPVRFDTFDGVEIQGAFYPSPGTTKAPCAILLHAVGGSIQQDGWDDIAKKLQAKNFSVLAFDFRGHGNSINVKSNLFWIDPNNQTVRRRAGKKDQISYKDFTTSANFGMMVNDIAAAKNFLDRKNDGGECNSANVILVGAESGCALGALYMKAAYDRQRLSSGFAQVTSQNVLEGQDYAGAIWLSPSQFIGGTKFSISLSSMLGSPVKERTTMLYLYGKDDKRSETLVKRLYNDTRRPDAAKTKRLTTMEKSLNTKLSGSELLGKPGLGTDEELLKFATGIFEDKGLNPHFRRDTDKLPLIRVPVERYLRQ